MRWKYLYLRNQLAATFTVSAFTLIGPYACSTGVCTQAESVCQNCVLGRCVCLCSIIVLQYELGEANPKMNPFAKNFHPAPTILSPTTKMIYSGVVYKDTSCRF